MKPMRKWRRNEARSLTFPTVAEGSFCVELRVGQRERNHSYLTSFFLYLLFNLQKFPLC